MTLKKALFIFVSALLIVGCSNDKADNPKNNESPKQPQAQEENIDAEPVNDNHETAWIEKFEVAPEVAYTPEAIVNQTKGPYSNAELINGIEGYEKLFEEFGEIPPDATNEELDKVFKYAVSQVAVDVPNPQELIDSWTIQSFGDPELEDARYHFKDQYNIEIILDSSGSMANVINGKTRMDIAKEAIQTFLKEAPENANVALRVYGHKGTSSDSDKKLSCDSSELVYSFNTYDESQLSKALNSFKPAGWTPLAQSLKLAQEDMKGFNGNKNTNMVYVVSDGIETCDGNPVEVAKSFADSEIQPILNIIGFDVDGEGQKQLKEMAKESNGTYSSANNADQLNKEFDKAKAALEAWESWLLNAEWDAEAAKVQRSEETYNYDTNFSETLRRQNNNITVLIRELRNKEQLTGEQWNYLDEKRIELYKATEEARITIKNDLKDINIEKLEETKKQIEEKYNQNTQ